MNESLKNLCETLRGKTRDLGAEVRGFLKHEDLEGEQAFAGQHSEMKANLMLSFRHLEDARMRLGKVMQQMQGGVSIFDRKPE